MAAIQPDGPVTFSLDGNDSAVASGNVPQLAISQTQPQAISPGLNSQQAGVNDVNAKTFRAITELASGVLAPKIKEAAQAQFVSGVQKAMTGEALGEIIKDQPWYTDIFAPSSALAGARAYTAQTAVAQWAGKVQEQMPQLAKVGPEQLQSAAVGAMQGFMTGDPAADQLITAHMSEQMAPLFKQQAKEHFIYMQKQASMAQLQAWDAAGKVYNNLAATEATGTGTVSPEDKEAAKSRFLGSIVPFADQSDQAYERNIQSFLEGAAAAGNFHVVRLFKDSGLYDKLESDKRADLDRTIHMFAKEAINKAIPQFAVDIAQLVNDPTQDPREIPAKVQALNDKAAKITGITEASLIPPQTVDNIVGSVMKAQRTAAEHAAAKAEDRRQKEQDKLDGVALAGSQIMLEPGRIDRAIAMGLVKKPDAEEAALGLFKLAKTPDDAAKVLNSRTEGGFETIKSLFGQVLRAEEYNDSGVGRMAQIYAGLAENVKPHYFDEHERKLMDRFNSQVHMGMPPQAAWVSSKLSPSVSGNLLPADAKSELQKTIRSEVESANEHKFMGIPTPFNAVDDAGLRTIEAVVAKTYKADRTNNPMDVAVRRSYAEARANGLDVQGQHVIVNTQPTYPPLFRMVGESEVGTAQAFETVMADKAKALDAGLDNYEAFRVDSANKSYIYVRSTNKEGKDVTWTINSDELKAAVTTKVKDKLMPKADLSARPDLGLGLGLAN